MTRGLSWVSCLSDMLTCEASDEFWKSIRLEMMKRGFWGNALCFRKTVWYVRDGRFVDLYYAIFGSFAEGFAPVGSWVLVFAIVSTFCLIICSPFLPSCRWWSARKSRSLLAWMLVFLVFFQVIECKAFGKVGDFILPLSHCPFAFVCVLGKSL